jgi:hypothetical protein
MWDMRRCIRVEAFPSRRISVQFDFSDLPASKRTWWLVSNGEEADLCPTDPGFDVGLYVATDLRTMTRVFMGDLSMRAAVSAGQIELDGTRELRQCFERWLGRAALPEIEDARNRDRADRRHSVSPRGMTRAGRARYIFWTGLRNEVRVRLDAQALPCSRLRTSIGENAMAHALAGKPGAHRVKPP